MTIIIVKQLFQRGEKCNGSRRSQQDGPGRGAVARAAPELQSTSFSEVLAHTGAPRGSVYHHFPDGKGTQRSSAQRSTLPGAFLVGALEQKAGASAEATTDHFLAIWRAVLTRSDCGAGCAVLAVTVATDAPELMAHATEVFRSWRTRLGTLLQQGGLTPAILPGLLPPRSLHRRKARWC